jgi:uncharacterized protein involved in exopolysaccharide biosynthesis
MEVGRQPVESDVSLGHLVRALWERRLFVAVFVVVFAGLMLTWRLLSPRVYRASALISVVDEKEGLSGSLGAIVGQLGALAPLAGGLGGANDARAIAMLQSRAVVRQYVTANNLLPVLYADRWDPATKRWKSGLFAHAPTLWDGVEKFIELRRVAQDSKTRLVTVTIDWKDAEVATRWCNDLIRITNETMRQRDLIESRRNIDYLTAQARAIDHIEVQNAVSALIQREMKREMLAKSTQDFALTVIDPAVKPEKPAPPGLILSTLLGAVAGGLIAIFMLLLGITMDSRRVERVS